MIPLPTLNRSYWESYPRKNINRHQASGCYEEFYQSLAERFINRETDSELLQVTLPMYELQPDGRTLQKLMDTCPLTEEEFYKGGVSEIRQSFSYLISALDRNGLLEKKAALEKSEQWFREHPQSAEEAARILGDPWEEMKQINAEKAKELAYCRKFLFDLCKEKSTKQWEPITLRMADEQDIPLSSLLPNESYQFTIRCRFLQDYIVSRDEWYQEELLDEKLPFIEQGYFNANTFFGKKGSLARIPKRIVIAYHPSMELEVTSEFLKHIFPSNSMDEESNLVRKITILGMEFPINYNRLRVANEMGDNLKIALPATEDLAVLGIISKRTAALRMTGPDSLSS